MFTHVDCENGLNGWNFEFDWNIASTLEIWMITVLLKLWESDDFLWELNKKTSTQLAWSELMGTGLN